MQVGKRDSSGNSSVMGRAPPPPSREKSAQSQSLGFLMPHAANDVHRKDCREKVPERGANWMALLCSCIAQTKRDSFYSGPKHWTHGSHLAWLQSPETPLQGAPAQSRCHPHLYLASDHSWMSICLLSAFSAELPSLNQNTTWVQSLETESNRLPAGLCLRSRGRSQKRNNRHK